MTEGDKVSIIDSAHHGVQLKVSIIDSTHREPWLVVPYMSQPECSLP